MFLEMFNSLLMGLLAFAFTVVLYAPFFEYLLHRYIMHKKLTLWRWEFSYPFRAHAGVHHHIFKADRTYHLIDDKDKWTIPMAWWNGPALVCIGTVPFAAAAWLLGIGHWWPIIPGIAIGCGLYYGAYEYLHWCMHLPKQRKLEMLGVFSFLNGHHVLHHRYMTMNFNVVLPFWDAVFGTLMVRSKLRFAQPPWPVPNLQPLV